MGSVGGKAEQVLAQRRAPRRRVDGQRGRVSGTWRRHRRQRDRPVRRRRTQRGPGVDTPIAPGKYLPVRRSPASERIAMLLRAYLR
jgi:hypothetical protein